MLHIEERHGLSSYVLWLLWFSQEVFKFLTYKNMFLPANLVLTEDG
jgi:hypothetical protein